MRIGCWNVNGLRACAKKNFFTWVKENNFDILCLQEVKAQREQLLEIISELDNYECFFSLGEIKGYSGVAILHKKALPAPLKVAELGITQFDREGRTLWAEYKNFILINCYFPNGGDNNKRVPFKLSFCEQIATFAKDLEHKKKKPVILCGDYNTAHTEIDLKNPKQNVHTTGFLPEERAWMDSFVAQDMVDAFRTLNPDLEGAYTYWSMRTRARERNAGWRLDYFFVSQSFWKKIKNCEHQTEVVGSDHCPIVLEF